MEEFKAFKFVNGINMAWVNFARDIGVEIGPEYTKAHHPDFDKFAEIFENVSQNGGTIVRWWYHTNGATNPVFDTEDEFVMRNPAFFESDLLALLDLAVAKGVKLQICLWSFDMLKGEQWGVNSARNKKLLTSNQHLASYLEHALIPLVRAVGQHPGLYAWELFNEPEGMTEKYAGHWTDFTDRITVPELLKVVNKMASAIRKAAPSAKITVGALGFLSAVTNSALNFENNYTDAKLQQAGGEAEGYLDFYNIHYYQWAGVEGSPFHTTFLEQHLDKPAIIAEYYPDETFQIVPKDLGVTLRNNGWHGSLVWSWTDRDWGEIAAILNATHAAMSNPIPPKTPVFLDPIRVFPNPALHHIQVINIPKTTQMILVTSLKGRIVERFTNGFSASSRLIINLKAYSAGAYVMTIKTATKTIHKRFIKQ